MAVPDNFQQQIRRFLESQAGGKRLSSEDQSPAQLEQEMIAESEEFFFEDKVHAAEILRGQDSLRASKLLCDVILCVDGVEFPCHKTVLVSSSSYFKAMFTGLLSESTQKTVYLKDVDSEILKQLIDFIYTSKLVITASSVHSLLAAANLFQILPVKTACCQYMEQQLSTDNCFSVHRMADTYSCPGLFEKARDFIIANFSQVSAHQDFLNLSAQELQEVISSDLLDVVDEEAVFDSIARWNSSNPDERDKNFHKILEHVRLPVLSPYCLFQRLEKFPAVKNCDKCKNLLEEAKRFHLLPDLRAEMRLEWTCFRQSHAFQEVIVSLVPGGQGQVGVFHTMIPQTVNQNLNIDLFLVKDHHAIPKVAFGTTLKSLPKLHKLQGIAALDSNLYLIGGELTNGVVINIVDKYNLEYDMWTQLTSMIVPRSQPGIALLYGCIYALGGRNGTQWMNSVECYNPQMNTWEKGIEMPVALQHITAVAFRGCIYASGIPVQVIESEIECKNVAIMLCYNSASKSWSELPSMPCPCYGATAYITNNQIYLIGGKNIALESTRTVQSYNPEDKKWSIQPSLLMQYYRPGLVVVNGVTFLGYDNSYPDKQRMFEYKNEKSNIWQMEVQESKKDYVQWTRCAVLKIRKDTLDKHATTYQTANAPRIN